MMKFFIFPVTILLFASCATQKKAQVQSVFPSFSAEGHRGARGLYPENSIGAMKLAIDLPLVTTLEMDCHITKDKKVIVYHDDFISPNFVTYKNGEELGREDSKQPVYSYTWQELGKFDIGSKSYKAFPFQKNINTSIVLLSDLIEKAEAYAHDKRAKPMFYNIEIKSMEGRDNVLHPPINEFTDLMLKIILDKGIAGRTVIQSFDKRAIRYVKKQYPQVKISYLVGGGNKMNIEELVADLGFKPFIISPNYKLVTEQFVTDAHRNKIKVIPWTVNSPADIDALRQLGVDGIISDYPNLL